MKLPGPLDVCARGRLSANVYALCNQRLCRLALTVSNEIQVFEASLWLSFSTNLSPSGFCLLGGSFLPFSTGVGLSVNDFIFLFILGLFCLTLVGCGSGHAQSAQSLRLPSTGGMEVRMYSPVHEHMPLYTQLHESMCILPVLVTAAVTY